MGNFKPICVPGVRSACRAQGSTGGGAGSFGQAGLPCHPHLDRGPLPNPEAGRGGPRGRGRARRAYPWWAAGSQAPGSRALRTALFRRALSW